MPKRSNAAKQKKWTRRPVPPPGPELKADLVYNQNEAATFLRVSPRTLEWWRVVGRGPRALKMGRRVVYRGRDLETFLDDLDRAGGSGAAA